MRSLLLLGGLALALSACDSGAPKPPVPPGKPGAAPGAKAGARTPNPPFAGEKLKNPLVIERDEIGKYGGTFVATLTGNPKSFNPIIANETSSTDIRGQVFRSCWGYDRVALKESTGLCENFDRSEDGLIYTFKLREGLRWSDGKPLTADDFEFSWQIMTDPGVPNSTISLFVEGKDEAGKPIYPKFEKVDARTFKFTRKTKDVLFHGAVGSIYVVPKHIWAETYKAGKFNDALSLTTPPEKLVGSGPFVIKSFKSDQRVVLERNPHFYGVDKKGNRLPYLDKIIYLVVPDNNAKYLRFTEGESFVLDVRPEHYDQLKRNEARGDYVIKNLGPSFATYYLGFNLDTGNDKEGNPYVETHKQKWFGDKIFRKAVSHAIDRDGIVRTVLHGRGVPLWGFYSPANKLWSAPGIHKYPYDLNKSRELLKTAGFVLKEGKLHDAGGKHIEFSMITNAENSTRIDMLNVIKDDLAKLGISAHIRPVPFNDVVTAVRNTRKYEALLLGWGSGVPPDPAQSRNVMLSSGASHTWFPNQKTPATPWEKRIDELVHLTNSSYDYATRKKHHDELLTIFSDEQPQIQLVCLNDYAAGRKNLGNFRPAALRKTLWDLDALFLKSLDKSKK